MQCAQQRVLEADLRRGVVAAFFGPLGLLVVVLLLLRRVAAVIEQLMLIPAACRGDRGLSGGLLFVGLALQEGQVDELPLRLDLLGHHLTYDVARRWPQTWKLCFTTTVYRIELSCGWSKGALGLAILVC